MKFVVNVPFGLYIFVMFAAFAVAVKIAFVMLALLGLYLIWCDPRLFLPPIILGIALKFWHIAVPVAVGIFVIDLAYVSYKRRKTKIARRIETGSTPPEF
jgi:hypothetical protein